MRHRFACFAALTAVLVTFLGSSTLAVDDSAINAVRGKNVLDSADLRVIDSYIESSLREMVRSKDLTEISKARNAIIDKRSDQGQYAQQFSESAYKHISNELSTLSSLGDEKREFVATVNLLILIDALEDPQVVRLALNSLGNKNKAIQYCAVRAVTNPGLVNKLVSSNSANSELVSEITTKLQGMVKGASPDIFSAVAQFAAAVNTRQGDELLLQIADIRISQYADWTVENELTEATILKKLYGKLLSAGVAKPEVAVRFAQLYSYVMQKFIRYANGEEFLTEKQSRQLGSVLIDVERTCISSILAPQSDIKSAVVSKDGTALAGEHKKLFGDQSGAGALATKLLFNYGKDASGNVRKMPLILPERPVQKASK